MRICYLCGRDRPPSPTWQGWPTYRCPPSPACSRAQPRFGNPHAIKSWRRSRSSEYRPNGAARALVQGQQPIVGVITRDTSAFGYARMLMSIEDRARRAGYVVAIAVLEPGDAERTSTALDVLLAQPIVGVIVLDYNSYDADRLRDRLGPIPIATVMHGSDFEMQIRMYSLMTGGPHARSPTTCCRSGTPQFIMSRLPARTAGRTRVSWAGERLSKKPARRTSAATRRLVHRIRSGGRHGPRPGTVGHRSFLQQRRTGLRRHAEPS